LKRKHISKRKNRGGLGNLPVVHVEFPLCTPAEIAQAKEAGQKSAMEHTAAIDAADADYCMNLSE
jgi:hypothetical protein